MRLLDRLRHGPVLYTLYSAGTARHVHADGFEREFRPVSPKRRYACQRCRADQNAKPGRLCWRCKGDDRLTERQRRYLDDVKTLRTEGEIERFPHCDENVLHARGTCWACDLPEYEALHRLRWFYSIRHTGESAPREADPCPSEAYRPARTINLWPGNRAL